MVCVYVEKRDQEISLGPELRVDPKVKIFQVPTFKSSSKLNLEVIGVIGTRKIHNRNGKGRNLWTLFIIRMCVNSLICTYFTFLPF